MALIRSEQIENPVHLTGSFSGSFNGIFANVTASALSINSPYAIVTLDGSGIATGSQALTYRNDTVSLTGSLSITNSNGSFAFVQNQGVVL
jgi:hypothetical protein